MSKQNQVQNNSLDQAINMADQLLASTETSAARHALDKIEISKVEIRQINEDRLDRLSEAIKSYQNRILETDARRKQYLTASTSQSDVEASHLDLTLAKTRKNEYEQRKQKEIRAIKDIEHDISCYTHDMNHESTSLHQQQEELENELSKLEMQLHTYRLLANIAFNEDPSPTCLSGFAKLVSVRELRPFEIDLNLTPADDLQAMFWSWLYEDAVY